ncbi:MAG TPA: hypothetical protein ENO09_08955, partial [bacterium]|nr:hypothetical protein [bacterium]
MKFATSLHAALLAAFALLLSACGGDSEIQPAATTDTSNRIYIVAGGAGSVGSGDQTQKLSVTLDAVHPGADWYTDRPQRVAGEDATDAFVNSAWSKT